MLAEVPRVRWALEVIDSFGQFEEVGGLPVDRPMGPAFETCAAPVAGSLCTNGTFGK